MRKYILILTTVLLYAFTAKDELIDLPPNWPAPAYDLTKNPLSKSKIFLGRTLFYDTLLSANNTISCESCHSPYSAFTHIDHPQSHGINGQIGTRNSPSLMNLAWQKSFMWDGAVNNLDMQPLSPISNPAEMGSSIAEVVKKLNASPKYHKLFYDAFGDSTATGERTLKAISQFMLTLVSADSKYDKVMRKEMTFTDQEANGYALFKKNCASCHTEPLFTNSSFENNGLPMDSVLKDIGRMKVTADPKDSLKFKVPSLRNIEYSYPYMHDGRFKKLSEVLRHYTEGIRQSPTLAPQLKNKIVLTSNEQVDLISFLLTLSDRAYIFNPQHLYPR